MALGAARKGSDAGAAEEAPSAKPRRLTEAEKQRWIEENREAFAAYDAHVEKHGLFGDGRRLF
ncbi:post-segregation antitoxin (ccd killing protein) [Azospirillum agricola]|uniref:type II toxin-antitoxin system CcdA family antitoxin n=1 Tax=Azospirillum agricola TaxID=1720247 RepID=UPI001AE84C93|nr:type II toxin-antitoxin system CcdA family antitoxin [Azospirillum agricola]MBP2228848.1 post-segregation antitoxin (ccd killing protein) [Azospirillum agricola]